MISSHKIIFTGITGLLGKYFLHERKLNYEIIGIGNINIQKNSKTNFRIDITDREQILDFTKRIKPQIIIHAASIGNVDYCEKYPDEAYQVNVEGTQNIIKAAKQVKARIIFLSSNAVYDGMKPPYGEKSFLKPIDVYGKTKMVGEKLIKRSNLKFCIMRLMTMYGWPPPGGRSNPVTWVIENLKKGERINIVNDIYNNHLWAGQAAKVLWKIIVRNIEAEIYNIAGKDNINRFELALKVAKAFKLDSSLIQPVNSDFFKSIARRPKNTCFETLKMEKELGIIPLSIDEGLRFMVKEARTKNR